MKNYLQRGILSGEHLQTLFVLSSGFHQVVDPLLEDLLRHAGFCHPHGIIRAGEGAEKTAPTVGERLDSASVPTEHGIHSRQWRL